MDDRHEPPSDSARFQRRVQAVFEGALDIAPGVREQWLEQECAGDDRLRAEVSALLSVAGESEKFLEHEQAERSLHAIESIESVEPGESVGPYRVVREVGRGGMGVVLLARRADGQFEQQVALKLLKREVNSQAILAAFLRERQILAWLQHPNIARLYDGGLTPDGRPWFALEYVEGLPITDYCAAKNLDLRARIQLIIDACEAIQHAHRNLVIHRDLKPSNLLVTDRGRLKLLDFGIAEVLRESESAPYGAPSQERAMTPEYAAPEQLLGRPVTTATDIHALGILLYELLTGKRPERFPSDSPELLLSGTTDSPILAPSRVAEEQSTRRFLRGDLDRILLKAIHKVPERRYSTAEALADDLRRFLAGLPVNARRQTVPYRLSKFVQRNRRGLLGIGVAAMVILGAGLFALGQSAQTRRERARAESVKDFLVNLVRSANPSAEGGAALRDGAILQVALERAGTELSGEPDMQAELYDVVGRAYLSRGDYASAEAPLAKVLELQRARYGNMHPAVVEALYAMAALRRREKRYDEAERYYEEALDMSVALNGRQTLEASALLNGLGANAYGAGDLDRAERYYRESLAIKEALLDEDDQEIATGRHNLALLLRRQGKLEKAENMMRRAIAARKEGFGDRHPIMAMSHGGLGRILHAMGRYDEAEREYRLAYDIRLEAYGTDHPLTRLAHDNLATVLYDAGDLVGAEKEFRSLLTADEHDLGKTDPEYCRTLCDLSNVLLVLDRVDETEAACSEAGNLVASLRPPHEELAGRVLALQGAVALARGRLKEALSGLDSATAVYAANEPALGEREVLRSRIRRGECLSRMGRYSEADSVLRSAYRTGKTKLGYTREAGLARDCLREHLMRTGRRGAASALD